MFIIAGLGNPDEKYQGTRHNVGFDVVDRLAEKYQIAVDTKKHRALIGKGVIEGQKVLLVKPQTYMNLSGEISVWKSDNSGSAEKEVPVDITESKISLPI